MYAYRYSSDQGTLAVEAYRPGYPRFTALLAAYNPFFICRRFDTLRARILLLKQDKLSSLEKRLLQIDEQETSLLFLGKSRSDRNADRLAVLAEIESCLVDYGKQIHIRQMKWHLFRTIRLMRITPRQIHQGNSRSAELCSSRTKKRRQPTELGRR
jgi:hypothetical protein